MPPSRPTSRPRRLRFRDWPVRWKLLAILVVPATVAGVVGAARVDSLLDDAERYRHDAVLSQAQRTVADLVDALDREQFTVTAGRAGVDLTTAGLVPAEVRTARTQYRTSVAVADIRDALAVEDDPVARAEIAEETRALNNTLLALGTVRPPSTAPVPLVEVTRQYDAAAAQAMRVMSAITGAIDDNGLQRQAFGSQALTEANRYSTLVDALVLAAASEGAQALRPGEVRAAADRQAAAYETFAAYVDRADDLLLNTDREVLLEQVLAQLDDPAAATGPLAVSAAEWAETVNSTAGALSSLARGFTGRQIVGATRAGEEARERAVVEGVLVAFLLAGGLALTVLVGETIARSLRRLARNAGTIAETDLPEALRRIRTHGPDSVTEVTTVGAMTRDEVGQVARAIDELNQQAVSVARDHERGRRANDDSHRLLANIVRRTQGLVERQVTLLDRLETDENDPDQLAQLFRLDHLAARMRRNNDNLMVLAGADLGGRGPASDLRVVDTVRAAVSETEQYERIDVAVRSDGMIAGGVARDIVHLLAELLDNATVFSPPESRVLVAAARNPGDGAQVTVTDRGIGLAPDALAEHNATLARPAGISAETPRHMGLFVVSQLAHRHGIRVSLAPAAGGGTAATVEVPEAAFVAGAVPALGRAGTGERPSRTERAAPPRDDRPVPEPPAGPRPSPGHPARQPSTASARPPASIFSAGADPLTSPAETTEGSEENAPIFASVSAWFRSDPGSARASTAPGAGAYASAADRGWSAAAAVSTQQHTELTAAGLPRRQPMTALLPGTADPESDPGASRDPDAVRGRLAEYGAGLQAARHLRQRSEPRRA
ncbi:MAG: ATP-binding protein [Kineosporiaceae bacterium]